MYSVKIDTVLGGISILSTEAGIAKVLVGPAENEFEPGDPFGAAHKLRQYLAGERLLFDLPLDIKGTEFQKRVWSAVSAVPYGKTVIYKELAQAIGNPEASRAVGSALSKNPVPIIIPCHRVVGSAGLTGYALGLDMKKFLLDLEKSSLKR